MGKIAWVLLLALGCGLVVLRVDAGAGLGSSADEPEPLRFSEVSAEAGIEEYGHSYSLAVADYNSDGLQDFAYSNHREVLLFTNIGGRFHRQSVMRGDVHGMSWIDWNVDGLPDLYVSTGGNRGRGSESVNPLLLSDGVSLGAEKTVAAIANAGGRGRFAVPWDVDSDNALDLLVFNWKAPNVMVRGGGGTTPPDFGPPEGMTDSLVGFKAVQGRSGEPLYIIVATSELRFLVREVDGSWRQAEADFAPPKLEGRPRELLSGDLDNDGDMDLLLVQSPWHFFGAQQVGDTVYFNLRGLASPPGASISMAARGRFKARFWVDNRLVDTFRLGANGRRAVPGELLNAGDADLSTGPAAELGPRELALWYDRGLLQVQLGANTQKEARYLGLIQFFDAKPVVVSGEASATRGGVDQLLLWEGGRFRDRSHESGLDTPTPGVAGVLADFDNDGDLDVFVVNGGLFGNAPDALYRNDGSANFDNIAESAGVLGPAEGRGSVAVALDYDNDGDLDLLVANGGDDPPGNTGPLQLYRNDTGNRNNWLKVILKPSASNSMALGARLQLHTRAAEQLRFAGAPSSNHAHSWQPVHFGLGKESGGTLMVTWPSGRKSSIEVESNQTVIVEEPGDRWRPRGDSARLAPQSRAITP